MNILKITNVEKTTVNQKQIHKVTVATQGPQGQAGANGVNGQDGQNGVSGAWKEEQIINITELTEDVTINLNPNANFHKFKYWVESEYANDKFALLCNNDSSSGIYTFQSNSTYNGNPSTNEDTFENCCQLHDQNMITKFCNGSVEIINPNGPTASTFKIIDSECRNAISTTSLELSNRMFTYNGAGEITAVKFGMKEWLLSSTAGRRLAAGQIIYMTLDS